MILCINKNGGGFLLAPEGRQDAVSLLPMISVKGGLRRNRGGDPRG